MKVTTLLLPSVVLFDLMDATFAWRGWPISTMGFAMSMFMCFVAAVAWIVEWVKEDR